MTTPEQSAALLSRLATACAQLRFAERNTAHLPNDAYAYIAARIDHAHREIKLATAYLSNLDTTLEEGRARLLPSRDSQSLRFYEMAH